MIRVLGIASVAMLLTTCCPSAWMTVTKGDPGPRPSVAAPRIATSVPIPVPTQFDNRVDVLVGGAPRTAIPEYADVVDPRDDVVSASSASLQAIDRLIAAYGDLEKTKVDPLPGDAVCLRAKPDCIVPGKCKAVVSTEQQRAAATRVARSSTSPSHADLQGYKPVVVRVIGARSTVTTAIQGCESPDAGPTQGTDNDRNVPCDIEWTGGLRIATTTALPIDPSEEEVTVCLGDKLRLADTLLSFVHVSDIQLRDGAVKLENPELSHRLDWVISSFEYDPDLASYNPYVVEALVSTINAEVEAKLAAKLPAEAPALVIHTGDSIDSGVISELQLMHRIIDHSWIPFYNVIGNHDLLIFGNLLPSTTDSDSDCITMESVAAPYFTAPRHLLPNRLCVAAKIQCDHCLPDEARFVAGSTMASSRETFIDGFAHPGSAALPQLHDQTRFACASDPDLLTDCETSDHGFDLNRVDKHLGYYAFPVSLAGDATRHALFVVLNSEDLAPHEGGNAGRVGAAQAAWLEKTLSCAHPHDLVFVFAHHPLGKIKSDGPRSVERILASSPNVVGFFYGHHHEHSICGDSRPDVCKHFWEVETGSIIEFPQEARMVRLKTIGGGLAFFEVFTFGEHEETPSREVTLGHRGAERDWCLTRPRDEQPVACSGDLRPYRTDGRHTNARLFFKLP